MLAALASAACSRQESAWQEARREDTVAAYEGYVARFPASAHAGEARAAILALRETETWARAERLGTPEAWQRYLADWPDGPHAALARQMLIDFLPPAPTAPVAPSGSFDVQLGAWQAEESARAALASWQGRRADLLEGNKLRLVAPDGPGPALWRLRAGPFEEAPARALCDRIRAAGTDCVPAVAMSAGDPAP
jgi:hypothetical protein